jgi:GcrA cell cycle regulator
MYMSKNAKKASPKGPKTLINLERNDCRWPIGEPRHPDFHFCGAPKAAGRPYCERHWRMAFQPARPRHQPSPAIPSATENAA